MGNKSHTTYFIELVKRLKEQEVDSGEDKNIKLPLSIDNEVVEDEFKFLELSEFPVMFEKMTPEEKEIILIWVNRNNIPYA